MKSIQFEEEEEEDECYSGSREIDDYHVIELQNESLPLGSRRDGQNAHLQVTLSANAPPMTGPTAAEIVYDEVIRPIYRPR